MSNTWTESALSDKEADYGFLHNMVLFEVLF